jgi:hypothetical protein
MRFPALRVPSKTKSRFSERLRSARLGRARAKRAGVNRQTMLVVVQLGVTSKIRLSGGSQAGEKSVLAGHGRPWPVMADGGQWWPMVAGYGRLMEADSMQFWPNKLLA